MRTKTIQARHLHAGYEIVEGGDGTRRTAHFINELYCSKTEVYAIVREGEGFGRRDWKPKDQVRVKVDDS